MPRENGDNGRWTINQNQLGMFRAALTYFTTVWIAFLVNVYALLPSLNTLSGTCCCIVYNMLMAGLVLSHLRCMCTNPGTAKEHLQPSLQTLMRAEAQKGDYGEVDSPGSTTSRQKWWCTDCDTFRPAGTHHCSTCRTCILEMDHHCTWVNNCVGWRNHKYFLLFLLYAWLGCLLSVLALGTTFCREFPPVRDQVSSLMSRLCPWTSAEAFATLLEDRFGSLRRGDFRVSLWCAAGFSVCGLLLIFITGVGYCQSECMALGVGLIDRRKMQSTADKSSVRPTKWISAHGFNRFCRVMGAGGPVTVWWCFPTSPGMQPCFLLHEEDEVIAMAKHNFLNRPLFPSLGQPDSADADLPNWRRSFET